MIRYSSDTRLYWDIWIILLAIWNALYIPFDIAFKPEESESPFMIALNAIIDLNFFFDIILTFRTTTYDKDGEEIFDWKKIAKNYLMGRFFIDFISTIPLDQLGNLPALQTFQLLKLLRLSRISKIIKNLAMKEDIKIWIKVLNVWFMLFIYLHCLAWLDFLIVNDRQQWVPPLWYVSAASNDLYTSGIVRQYAISFYISILMFGGNEIGGTNEIELAFTGLAMLFSTIINALIFGEMAVLVEAISRKENEFQEKIDTSNTAMKNLNLPDDLQDEVRESLIFTQSTLEQQQEMAKFFQMISSSLKVEVSQQIFYSVAKQNDIIIYLVNSQVLEFSKTLPKYKNMAKRDNILRDKENEIISNIVQYLTVELKNPEDIIIEQNSWTREMYYVANGVCTVDIVDQAKKLNKNIRNLLPGDHFGEIGMIYGTPRTATVLSKNYSTLAKMSLEIYHDLTTEYPTMVTALKEHIYSRYDDPLTLFCKESLERIPYFQNIGNEAIYDVMFTLTKRFWEKGEVIQKVGEDANTMYIILNGMIELYTFFEDHSFVLERLWRGSVMNYRTFFQRYEAQVASRCITKTILLELKYEQIVTLTKYHKEMESNFLKFEKNVLKEEKSYPLDYIMNLPDRYYEQAGEGRHEAGLRENIFKNVVMRRLYEIRELKAKPKLKDMLLQQLNTNNISDWKAKIEIKRKIRKMWEKNTSKQFDEDISKKFNRIITNLERTLKVLTAENLALNSVEEKLKDLPQGQAKRKKSMKKNKSQNKQPKNKDKQKTKILPYGGIEDQDYDSNSEEEKAARIENINKFNNGFANVAPGTGANGEDDKNEELQFSFESSSSIA